MISLTVVQQACQQQVTIDPRPTIDHANYPIIPTNYYSKVTKYRSHDTYPRLVWVAKSLENAVVILANTPPSRSLQQRQL
jgi:hypothetical protein